MANGIIEVSKETLLLRDYTKDVSKGQIVRYTDAEQRTGVSMDSPSNRTKLLNALAHNGHVGVSVRGVGYYIPATAEEAIDQAVAPLERRGMNANKKETKLVGMIRAAYEINEVVNNRLHIIEDTAQARYGVRIGGKVFGRVPKQPNN